MYDATTRHFVSKCFTSLETISAKFYPCMLFHSEIIEEQVVEHAFFSISMPIKLIVFNKVKVISMIHSKL